MKVERVEGGGFEARRMAHAYGSSRPPFGVCGLGFGVWGLGFGLWALGFEIRGLGYWLDDPEKESITPPEKSTGKSLDSVWETSDHNGNKKNPVWGGARFEHTREAAWIRGRKQMRNRERPHQDTTLQTKQDLKSDCLSKTNAKIEHPTDLPSQYTSI